jgi:hypothetical protein
VIIGAQTAANTSKEPSPGTAKVILAEWMLKFGFKIPFGGPNDGPSFYGDLAGSTPDVKKKHGKIKDYGNFENLGMRGEVDVTVPLSGNAPPQIGFGNFPEKNLGRKGIPQRLQ